MRGFGALEILISVSVVVLLTAVIFGAMNRFRDGQELELAAGEVQNAVREARSLFLVLFFLFGFFRLLWKYLRIRRGEREKIRVLNEQYENRKEKIKNERWQKIAEHLESGDPSRWRLAIIEADIMLDDLLSGKGYAGDTIGDKLKGVDRSDFLSLDDAWSAHKVRNNIAHEGSDFILTQRQARATIVSYKKVFDEFRYI